MTVVQSVCRYHLWFGSHVVSRYTWSSTKPGTQPMPWCFPEIPSFQFACQSKRNALDKRQRHLASEYCLKVSSDVTNPAHS